MDRKSLSVWLITVGEPLPLEGNTSRLWRSGLIADTLVGRGHKVTWWTSTVNHFNKQFFVTSSQQVAVRRGLTLQFLHGPLYKKNISVARWRNHLEIAREFARIAAGRPPPDLILCSYPTIELSVEAVHYGDANGVPVLLDIRDLWPDELAARLPGPLRPAAPYLLWPMYRNARRALGGASGIVAISETYLAWALRFGMRTAGRWDRFVPMGYEAAALTRTVPEQVGERLRALGVDPTRRIVWFCGTFVGSIDLQTAIRAAALLSDDCDVQFVLTGSGEWEPQLRAQAQGLTNVIFTGWANRDELAWLASQAWVGLGAYKKGAMMSLPNKIFEYMAASLPVLCCLEGEAKALIEHHGIGATYAAADAAGLAGRIRELAADPQARQRLSSNAQNVFRRHFAADIVYAGLAEHIEQCAASWAGGRPSQ